MKPNEDLLPWERMYTSFTKNKKAGNHVHLALLANQGILKTEFDYELVFTQQGTQIAIHSTLFEKAFCTVWVLKLQPKKFKWVLSHLFEKDFERFKYLHLLYSVGCLSKRGEVVFPPYLGFIENGKRVVRMTSGVLSPFKNPVLSYRDLETQKLKYVNLFSEDVLFFKTFSESRKFEKGE